MIEIIGISEIENLEEAKKKTKVVRKGKVVTKEVETDKRPQYRTAKQRMALKKARRKSKMGLAKRKRKKSMKRRSRISAGQQKLATRFMQKRRAKRRREGAQRVKRENLIYYGEDNLFIAEDGFTLRDTFGEYYEIGQGYLFDAYDNGFDIMVDIYNVEGELAFEAVEVLPEKIYRYFTENLVDLVYEEELDEDYEYIDEDTKLEEMSGPKLKAGDRKLLNSKLYDLTSPLNKKEKRRETAYFQAIPLKDIGKILAIKNILIVDEDEGTEFQGWLLGSSSSDYFALAYKVKNKEGFYTPIVNAQLALQWHKMPSGRYEINTYIG